MTIKTVSRSFVAAGLCLVFAIYTQAVWAAEPLLSYEDEASIGSFRQSTESSDWDVTAVTNHWITIERADGSVPPLEMDTSAYLDLVRGAQTLSWDYYHGISTEGGFVGRVRFVRHCNLHERFAHLRSSKSSCQRFAVVYRVIEDEVLWARVIFDLPRPASPGF